MLDINYPQHISIINLSAFIFLSFIVFIYRFIYPKRKINLIILLITITIIPVLSIFRGGTYQSGDLTPHYIHLITFYTNLTQGNFIPRWAGDLCGSYGCPIFIVEYLLPYYFASFFHFLGFAYVDSMKLVLALSFIISGITMYFWAKDEMGKVPGFIAAIFYLFAPYHLIDLHFRGGVGEIVSFALIPLLFLFTRKFLFSLRLNFFYLLSITVFSLIISQANTAISALTIVSGYALIIIFKSKKDRIKKALFYGISVIYGILLSSFYWLTAISEIKYTWWSRVTVGDFKPINEYLFSPALFGFLFQGNQGEYRLIIGYFHLLAVVIAIYLLIKHKIKREFRSLLMYLIVIFFALFFMMLSPSEFIWRSIPILDTFMMVWRLLIPISFITAAIAGIIFVKQKNTKIIMLVCFLVITSTVANWANRKMVPLHQKPFYNESEFYTEYYLKNDPILVENLNKNILRKFEIVANPPEKPMEFLQGKGEIIQLKRNQTEHVYILNAESKAKILENTNYFPGWKVYANYKNLPINIKEKEHIGKIVYIIDEGLYKIEVKFEDTSLRKAANIISLTAFTIGLLYLIFIYFKKGAK